MSKVFEITITFLLIIITLVVCWGLGAPIIGLNRKVLQLETNQTTLITQLNSRFGKVQQKMDAITQTNSKGRR